MKAWKIGLLYPSRVLGKALANKILPELKSATEPELKHDSSTNALIRRFRQSR